jgi:hypothetical protein
MNKNDKRLLKYIGLPNLFDKALHLSVIKRVTGVIEHNGIDDIICIRLTVVISKFKFTPSIIDENMIVEVE